MRIAITGGTGFVGSHLARSLSKSGHDVVVLARGVDQRPSAREIVELPGVTFLRVGTGDEQGLAGAFAGCDAVAHCAGINRQLGPQTYEAVHVHGTANVVRAAETAGVRRLVFVSFLRARPDCGSPYHESKWAAEELVRSSTCDWTVLKPGMMFGRGDHMLDHLSDTLCTFPVFLGVGHRSVRPLAVEDAVDVLVAALVGGRLSRTTTGLVGPTEIGFDDAALLVARVLEKRRMFVTAPIAFHYLIARIAEATMTVPIVSLAQVRILQEEVVEPFNAPDLVPGDLVPRTPFDSQSIRAGLPEPDPIRLDDLRWFGGRRDGPDEPGDARTAVLVFDGDCGLCTSSARWAERRFRHGERAEAWQVLGDLALASFGLSVTDVEQAAWWVDDAGTRERGHRAVGRALQAGGGWRRALGRVVLTPPTSWIAAGVYRVVVRWRYRLPGGTPACRVDPGGPVSRVPRPERSAPEATRR